MNCMVWSWKIHSLNKLFFKISLICWTLREKASLEMSQACDSMKVTFLAGFEMSEQLTSDSFSDRSIFSLLLHSEGVSTSVSCSATAEQIASLEIRVRSTGDWKIRTSERILKVVSCERRKWRNACECINVTSNGMYRMTTGMRAKRSTEVP